MGRNGIDGDIPDILAGGDGDKEKPTKGNKVATKLKANKNGGTATRSRGQANQN